MATLCAKGAYSKHKRAAPRPSRALSAPVTNANQAPKQREYEALVRREVVPKLSNIIATRSHYQKLAALLGIAFVMVAVAFGMVKITGVKNRAFDVEIPPEHVAFLGASVVV